MKSRIKTIIYTVLMCAIVLIGSYMYAHIDKTQVLYDEEVDTTEYIATGNLEGEFLEQVFVCKEDSLDGVSVKCQLFGDVSEVKIEYQLLEDSGKLVARSEIAAIEIKNNQLSKFLFEDKVTGCREKQYILRINQKNTTEENGVGFCYENNAKDDTELTIGGEEKEGTLIAKTITKRFDVETFVVVVSFIVFIWGFFKVLYKLFK